MNELTPAQKRLIIEAQGREKHIINFFGIPEKTKLKLIEQGYVVTVPQYSEQERETFRAEAQLQSDTLKELLADLTTPQYHLERCTRNIALNINKIFRTTNVLTDKAMEVK